MQLGGMQYALQISHGCVIKRSQSNAKLTARRIVVENAVEQEHVAVMKTADGNVLHKRHSLHLLEHLVNGLIKREVERRGQIFLWVRQLSVQLISPIMKKKVPAML